MGWLTVATILVIVINYASHATQPPSHHINVCHFVPTDEEIQEISQRQHKGDYDPHESNEYSHEIIKIKKHSPREHILVSIVEDERSDEPRDQYLYTVQAVLPSGKPVGKFKSFDEYMTMRKCGEKEVFLNEQSDVAGDGSDFFNSGVTFEWVAPTYKVKGTVSVIVTKINMNLLHRHNHDEEALETAGYEN